MRIWIFFIILFLTTIASVAEEVPQMPIPNDYANSIWTRWLAKEVLGTRLLEEGMWGLDWVLKTSFHDGFRPSFCLMDRWTNSIVGDVDDMTTQATNNAASNFSAAATEAIAARVLRDIDPMIAKYSLKQAIEDWGFVVPGGSESPRGTGQTGKSPAPFRQTRHRT